MGIFVFPKGFNRNRVEDIWWYCRVILLDARALVGCIDARVVVHIIRNKFEYLIHVIIIFIIILLYEG